MDKNTMLTFVFIAFVVSLVAIIGILSADDVQADDNITANLTIQDAYGLPGDIVSVEVSLVDVDGDAFIPTDMWVLEVDMDEITGLEFQGFRANPNNVRYTDHIASYKWSNGNYSMVVDNIEDPAQIPAGVLGWFLVKITADSSQNITLSFSDAFGQIFDDTNDELLDVDVVINNGVAPVVHVMKAVTLDENKTGITTPGTLSSATSLYLVDGAGLDSARYGRDTSNPIEFRDDGGNMQSFDVPTYSTLGSFPTYTGTKGWHFDGWANALDGEVVFDDATDLVDASTVNSTLYAKWTQYTYTINYNKGTNTSVTGNSMASVGPVGYETATTLSDCSYLYEGFAFMGWATSENGTKVYNWNAQIVRPDVADNGNAVIDLYPAWQANKYEVTYHVNAGGTVKETEVQTIGSGETLISITDLAASGKYNFTYAKEFIGWSQSAVADGATVAPSVFADAGSLSTLIDVTGWKSTDEGWNEGSTAKTIDLYAVWKVTLTYSKTFDTGETNIPEPVTKYTYNTAASIEFDLDDDGSTYVSGADVDDVFCGWALTNYATGNIGGYPVTTTGSTGIVNLDRSTTYYSIWKTTYTMTFHNTGGTGYVATMDLVLYNTDTGTLVLAADPEYEGRTFNGWWMTDELTAAGTKVLDTSASYDLYKFGQDVADVGTDLDFYATWTYTVTYAVSGQPQDLSNPMSVPTADTSTVVENAVAHKALPAIKEITGYTTKWVVGETKYAPGAYFDAVSPALAVDTTLTTEWAATTYTIVFTGNGATGTMAPVEYIPGTALTLPRNLFTTTEGNAFHSWTVSTLSYKDQAVIDQFDEDLIKTNVGGTITLTAAWKSSVAVSITGNTYYNGGSTNVMTLSIVNNTGAATSFVIDVVQGRTVTIHSISGPSEGLTATYDAVNKKINVTAPVGESSAKITVTVASGAANGQYPVIIEAASNQSADFALTLKSGMFTVGSTVVGDVNFDGRVNTLDYAAIKLAVLTSTSSVSKVDEAHMTFSNDAQSSLLVLKKYINHSSSDTSYLTLGVASPAESVSIVLNVGGLDHIVSGAVSKRTLVVEDQATDGTGTVKVGTGEAQAYSAGAAVVSLPNWAEVASVIVAAS